MRFKCIVLSIIAILYGCDSKKRDFEERVKKIITDEAFINNSTVDFIDFRILGYEIVSSKYLDSITLVQNKIEKERWRKLAENIMDLLSSANTLKSVEGRSIERKLEDQFDGAIENMRRLKKSDSLINLNLKSKFNKEEVYKVVTYEKITVKNNSHSENYIDTSTYFFNKKLNRVYFNEQKEGF